MIEAPGGNLKLSNRIDLLRVTFIVGLVLLHYGTLPGTTASPFRGMDPSLFPIATFVNAFVSVIFLTAVPLLSAISGWLFFRDWKAVPGFFLRRYWARARSILLPMVLWNLATLLGFLALYTVDPEADALAFVAYDLGNLDVAAVVNALFGVTRHPINFQFWFLSDLLLTILLSPLLAFGLTRMPIATLAGLFLVWIGDFTLGIFFRTDVLFFFALGAFIRFRALSLPEVGAPAVGMLVFAFLVAAALRASAPALVNLSDPMVVGVVDVLTRLMRLLGVAAFWLAAARLPVNGATAALVNLAPLAFFLHAAHWPLNQFVKGRLATLMPPVSELGLLANYVATTALTLALVGAAAAVLSRLVPDLYAILSGGRTGVFGTAPSASAFSR